MKHYEYGIIGNCASAALVTSDCSIVWLCLPYFDSASVFAEILDKDKGGHFKIVPSNLISTKQEYILHTAILKTTFVTKDGVLEVNDYMPRYETTRNYYYPSEVHRKVRVISGSPKIRVQLDARPNYALSEAVYEVKEEYIKIRSQKGDYNSFYLYSTYDLNSIINGDEIELIEYSYFLFSYNEKIEKLDNDKLFVAYEKTKSYWLDWGQRTRYPEKYKEEVLRSAITLKLLMFQRTGAVVAAATTSMPEIIGKDRNWDYRFCWVRDSAMIIDLYVRIGHIASAEDFLNFILEKMQLKHEDIGVMYGINGEEELTEISLDHLSGYENSKPVRIGNDAYRQKQNDVYGQLMETIYTFYVVNKRADVQLNEEIWTMVRSLVNRVKDTWRQPDSGIWERREALQNYVHSRLMSWVAMERAVNIANHIGRTSYVEEWASLAEDIKVDILKNGWNEELQAFTMYYGSDMYDASNLLMLHYGFLSPKDPRMISTVQQSYKHLVKNNLTFRYIHEDEFGAPENCFIVCTFWMINALYLIGEKQKAKEMFDEITSCSNHLGLFSEDVEITTKRLTGNFPQGYSHLAYIQTALLFETDYDWGDTMSLRERL
ncbi:MAG: GH15 family glucan-1,4-alpha-glucosidase [Lysobacterales bacterium]|jgi:GH15 family glucan-1,4-alpha-glucosidase